MFDQLEYERQLTGGSSFKDLVKEMVKIPGNRKRALITVGLMICQQMTGKSRHYISPAMTCADMMDRYQRDQLLREPTNPTILRISNILLTFFL